MKRARLLMAALIAAGVAEWGGALAATTSPAPVMFQSAPGRFEVAAVDVGGAQRVVALAGEAWLLLAAPLVLPESFASPVFVRLIPGAEWGEGAPFRVVVEAGGVVSVRVRWEAATPETIVRRALIQGLVMRQAVARHGVNSRLSAPLWLEHACLAWWQTRAVPAQLDAWKQAGAQLSPPSLVELLTWQRGEREPLERSHGALGLLTLFVAESGRAGEWPALLHRLLGGEEPLAALAASFPARFSDERQRELWWQTAWHQLLRARVLPVLEVAESRAELAELARFVFAREGRDAVVPLREVLARAREPIVDAELKARAAALNRVLPALHPFFRNAALSLAEALAQRGESAARREALCATFEADWRDAAELADASRAALDALERRARPSG